MAWLLSWIEFYIEPIFINLFQKSNSDLQFVEARSPNPPSILPPTQLAAMQPAEPSWPVAATFEEALTTEKYVFEEAAIALPSLPHRDLTRHYPATMTDAVALVHARDDMKKKVAAAKAAARSKRSFSKSDPPSPTHGPFPGVRSGGLEPSAFWMYTEDYFRDVSQEDLRDILEHYLKDPAEDPVFRVPACGVLSEASTKFPTPEKPVTAEPAHNGFNSNHGERRSHRSTLGKGGKFTEDSPWLEVPAGMMMGTEPSSSMLGPQEVPATAENASTRPLSSEVGGTTVLLEAVADDLLAKLALQLTDLIKLSGKAKVCEPLIPSSVVACSACVKNGGGSLKNRAAIEEWIKAQSKVLSDNLGCLLNAMPSFYSGPTHPTYLTSEPEEREGPARVEAPPASTAPLVATGRKEAGAEKSAAEEQQSQRAVLLPLVDRIHPYMRMLLSAPCGEHLIAATMKPPPPMESTGRALEPAASMFDTSAAVITQELGPSGAQIDAIPNVVEPQEEETTTTDTHHADGDDDLEVAKSVRNASRARSQMNYAVLAGTRKSAPRPPSENRRNPLSRGASMLGDALSIHPIALSVNAMVKAGVVPTHSNLEMPVAPDPIMLASAPQDEVTAEMLALQAELASTMAVNRGRIWAALQNLMADLPTQEKERRKRLEEESIVKSWASELQEIKQQQNQALKEAAHREAMAQKQIAILESPRPVLGRRSTEGVVETGAPFLSPDDLYDVLAQRSPDEEAFCAVCADGHSEAPNMIIFCERCDVAVHQRCYDVPVVPEGEWLCWPCQMYEEEQRATGKSQSEIRPPRWQQSEHKPMDGGGRSCKCALCPVRYGAFRQTVDRTQWVHQACAMWTPEVYLRHGDGPAVVDGIDNIRPERLALTCAICCQNEGAPIQCAFGACQHAFHVLCARNVGLYLSARNDTQGRPQYKVYCAVHGPAQREKDQRVWAARAPMGAGHQRRPGRPPGSGGGRGRGRHPRSSVSQPSPALLALQAREDQRSMLNWARVNLESCRMLIDQCKRRERIKKQLLLIEKEVHAERMQNPDAAIAFLEKERLLGQDTLLAEIEMAASMLSPPVLSTEELRINAAVSPAVRKRAAAEASSSFVLPPFAKRTRGTSNAVVAAPVDSAWTKAHRRMMTTEQVAAANKNLPPQVKFFPLEELMTGSSKSTSQLRRQALEDEDEEDEEDEDEDEELEENSSDEDYNEPLLGAFKGEPRMTRRKRK